MNAGQNAVPVDYYSSGNAELEFIHKDKQNFFEKWKELEYDIVAPVETDLGADSDTKLLREKAENFWKQKRVGTLKIVCEKQKIIHRDIM